MDWAQVFGFETLLNALAFRFRSVRRMEPDGKLSVTLYDEPEHAKAPTKVASSR